MSDNIKVAIRVRPLIQRELQQNAKVLWDVRDTSVVLQREPPHTLFRFDRVFSPDEDNQIVYQDLCSPLVEAAMSGFNGTIFAYGQTSSGKTYTMNGENGIIRNTVEDIFTAIDNMPERTFLIRVSYLEIYNETLIDLTIPKSQNLKIKEDADGMINVVGLKEIEIKSSTEVFQVLKIGERNRSIGETQMNEKSSRSHTIFRMIVESRLCNGDVDEDVCVAHLNLVDLAGSERASQNKGNRFKEGIHINKSLFTLSTVIRQLSDGDKSFVNYRDSKLTRILQNSLGGNAHTVIICTITPASNEHTISTLKFADRAKYIKNKPVINVVSTDRALLKRYDQQIKKLTDQLQELQKQNENPEVWKKLEETSKQNEDLKMQIKSLKEKFLVSQLKTHHLPKISKSSRRETWCFGLQNRLRPLIDPPSVNVMKHLPILKEEDSTSPQSPGFKMFDIKQKRSSSASACPSSWLLSPDNRCCSSSTQTEADKDSSQLKVLLKKAESEIRLLSHHNQRLREELSELREFTMLEKQMCFEESDSVFLIENLKAENTKLIQEISQVRNSLSDQMEVAHESLYSLKQKCTSQSKPVMIEQAVQVDNLHETVRSKTTLVENCVQVNICSEENGMLQRRAMYTDRDVQVELSCEVAKLEKHIQTDLCDRFVSEEDEIKGEVQQVISVDKSAAKKDFALQVCLEAMKLEKNVQVEIPSKDSSEPTSNLSIQQFSIDSNTSDSLKILVEQVQKLQSSIQESCQNICHLPSRDIWNIAPCYDNKNSHLVDVDLWQRCEKETKELKSTLQILLSNQAKVKADYDEMRKNYDMLCEWKKWYVEETHKRQLSNIQDLQEFLEYKKAKKIMIDKLQKTITGQRGIISRQNAKNKYLSEMLGEFHSCVALLKEQFLLHTDEMGHFLTRFTEDIVEMIAKHENEMLLVKQHIKQRWQKQLVNEVERVGQEAAECTHHTTGLQEKIIGLHAYVVENIRKLKNNLLSGNELISSRDALTSLDNDRSKFSLEELGLRKLIHDLELKKSNLIKQIKDLEECSRVPQLPKYEASNNNSLITKLQLELKQALHENAELKSANQVAVHPVCPDLTKKDQATAMEDFQSTEVGSAAEIPDVVHNEHAAENAELLLENRDLQQKVHNLEQDKKILAQKVSVYKTELRRIQANTTVQPADKNDFVKLLKRDEAEAEPCNKQSVDTKKILYAALKPQYQRKFSANTLSKDKTLLPKDKENVATSESCKVKSVFDDSYASSSILSVTELPAESHPKRKRSRTNIEECKQQ